jgi:hypothetical protein
MNKSHIVSVYAALFLVILVGQAGDALGQSRSAKSRTSKPSTTKTRKLATISLGCINGKAIELVKPDYPPAAKAVSVSGFVFVDVLLDAHGRVVSANSKRGHPLLVPASVKAALASTFEPVTIGGNPVQVTGIIVYRYLPSSMNWLELGYAADSIDTLTEYLPAGFNEERSFLELSRSNPNDIARTMEAAWSIINGKLGSNEKARWLIAVGRNILSLSQLHWHPAEKKALFGEIQILLNTSPENVSGPLQARLIDLIDAEKADAFDENLLSLIDNLFQLGR